LQIRLANLPANEIATTIVTYEEQMRGWLAVVNKAQSPDQIVAAYERLSKHIETYKFIRILNFDHNAAVVYDRLRHEYRKLGSMDLKIAAIAIANRSTLLTRNLKHFGDISELNAEDWTV
jgi:tRNA(fMet)-specific endonuclease VapC